MSVTRRRINAVILDNVLLAVPFFWSMRYGWGVWVFAVALALVYFQISESTTGQTVGKAVFKVRVVTRDYKIADSRSIAARTILRLFEEPVIALIAIFVTPGRRRLGDLAAGTIVVDASYPVQTRRLTAELLGYPACWLVPALIVCVLWAQGHFPGSYRTVADKICEVADEMAQESTGPFELARVTRRETDLLASLNAPANWEERHAALVAEYRALSAHLDRSVRRAARSADRAARWQREWAALVRHSQRSNARLAQLGYRGCAGETTSA